MDIISFIIFGNWVFSLPLVYRALVKPLDAQLKDKETFYLEEDLPGLSQLYRGFQYASLIVFPKQMKKPYYQLTYGDFNFRSALSKPQLIIAYYYYLSSCAFALIAIVVALHDLVFFRSSPWLSH